MEKPQIRARLLQGGRVTLPKSVRDAKGWTGGQTLVVETMPNGSILLRERTPEEAKG